MTIGTKYKTLSGNTVEVTGAAVANYFIKEIFSPNSATVIICECENESGETEYWLSNQLMPVVQVEV